MGGMEELAEASKYWYQNVRKRSNSREVMLRRDTALKKPLKNQSHFLKALLFKRWQHPWHLSTPLLFQLL